MSFEKGIFTLSLDFELIWGTLDHSRDSFRELCIIERREVIDRLLSLLGKYNISATWCIVGHLFLAKCEKIDGVSHPEIVRPNHSWVEQDWFEFDENESENESSIFVGQSLVEKIRDFPVHQEIGSHSFSHVIFSDSGCSRETAISEIKKCVIEGERLGIELKSFVFPRNEVGHLDVIKELGFRSYRGLEPNWYENKGFPKKFRRIAHFADILLARKPPVVMPIVEENGLVNIPGSSIFFPAHGARRHIPIATRVRRCKKGIDQAIRENKIFHLWFHPTNMADEIEGMFRGLEEVFSYLDEKVMAGAIEILTMNEVVDKVLFEGAKNE